MTPLSPAWEIAVNRAAQRLDSTDVVVAAFSAWPIDEQRTALRALHAMVLQSHPRAEEIPAAIAASGVRPTRTSAVLVAKGPLAQRLAEIANLPATELLDGLLLGVALLAIADRRRRETRCASGCAHWWHHLDDELLLARLRARPE